MVQSVPLSRHYNESNPDIQAKNAFCYKMELAHPITSFQDYSQVLFLISTLPVSSISYLSPSKVLELRLGHTRFPKKVVCLKVAPEGTTLLDDRIFYGPKRAIEQICVGGIRRVAGDFFLPDQVPGLSSSI